MPDTLENNRTFSRRTTVLLWIIQVLLAVVFLLAGGSKLALPGAALARQTPLPVGFLRFIGFAEVAGGLGLVLPGAFRVKVELTALAACGLVVIMIGATAITLASHSFGAAIIPALVGLLAAWIALERRP